MKKIKGILVKLEESILILCFSVMGLVLFLQVIMRFVFNMPLSWVEELARYLQIWITFLGIGYGVRKGSHISMDLVSTKLNKGAKYAVSMFCDAACLWAFSILLKTSFVFLSGQNVLSTAMRIPMQLVYAVIPIGTVVYMLYVVNEMVGLTKEQFIGEKLSGAKKQEGEGA